MQKQTIRITDEWYDEFKSMPFTSKKKGKMLNLLKASAKPINKNKNRKVIPLLGKIGDFHKANIEIAKQSKKNPLNSLLPPSMRDASENDGEDSEMNK